MTGKYFLDTNFLLYCFNRSQPAKREKCLDFLSQFKENSNIVISTQVLKEFTSVMISKLKVDPKVVKQIVKDLMGFEIVQVTTEMILSAIDIHILYNYSFWDSLIISSAIESKCNVLISEDMHHGHKISGLIIENPFST